MLGQIEYPTSSVILSFDPYEQRFVIAKLRYVNVLERAAFELDFKAK